MYLSGIFILQFLIGFGILDRFEIITKISQKLSLSVLMGFFFSSLTVYALEVVHIRLSLFSIFSALALLTAVINFNPKHLVKRLWSGYSEADFLLEIYEVVFLGAISYLLFFSFWKTYSSPVTPYDSVVGIDLVAKQAVREGHIVSSIFFREDFRPFLSTQPYYAPFTMLMQIIYRVAGLPFGQLWLGILTISFFVFAYSKMCERLHPITAGFFLLLLICAPELYAYTFLLQTDFSNAVFFAIGMIFTMDFLESKSKGHFMLGALFMAAACWSRTETIILAMAVSGVMMISLAKDLGIKSLNFALAYLGICSIPTVLWNFCFFKFYFPVVPELNEQVAWNGLYSMEKSSRILDGMNSFFFNSGYWGYLINIFLGIWLINFAFYRHKKALWPVVWLLLFYVCFFVMLHHFRLMNIEYTFRRAVMKFLLLMCLLLTHLPILHKRARFSIKVT